MQKRYFLILLLVFSLNLVGQEFEIDKPLIQLDSLRFGEDETFEVISWNIQNFPKHEHTVELSAEIINAISPDIIALQEIQSHSAFVDLVINLNLLDEINVWDGYRAFSDEWELDLAYVFKKNVIEVINIFEIYEEEEYDYAFPRRPLVMELIYNDEELVIINNHFKAMQGKENELRRKEAVKNLKTYVESEYDLANIIIVGDLNDHLTDTGNDNVFLEILEDNENFKFADFDVAVDSTANWSYPYWKYRGHIDHIIISNELFDEFEQEGSYYRTIVIDKYMEGGEDRRYQTVTDHRPVGLKLKFK
ncbi:MAG: hypothetical protein APR54_10685 [Candidatus Cloacimonas sp. SDB]|nr:MAG: hypothetical protein APR54_10685 [Candidatus Cloacimonas sp. SDB]